MNLWKKSVTEARHVKIRPLLALTTYPNFPTEPAGNAPQKVVGINCAFYLLASFVIRTFVTILLAPVAE